MNNIIQENIILSKYTTLKLGGNAQFFSAPYNIKELQYLLKFAQDKLLDIFILGKGSNILVRKEGVRGLVISTENLVGIEFNNNYITVQSGYSLKKLILDAVKRNLSGLEGLAEIPASIGGCVFMNAGGKFGNIGSLVERCWTVDFCKLSVDEIDLNNLKFSYRQSNLQDSFIYKVRLKLQPSEEKCIYDKLQNVISYKIGTQPISTNNAGCIFKNPVDNSAGMLIDQCGLKGYKIGGASISTKHSNFFVNNGGDAEDMIKLIEIVQIRVYERFGINLEREIKIWPDEPNYKF